MTRRERLERKLERRREWAEKAETRSASHWQSGSKMFDAIPFGQPILVGHHSERRDRNYRGRAAGHLDKACELSKLAEHHTSKAGGLETQLESSIYSDDNDAVAALEARIAEREADRERMVLVNKLYRKADVEGLKAVGIDYEALKTKLAAAGGYWGKAPHLPYEMQNLGGRITADRKRLEAIRDRQKRQAQAEASPNGVTLREGGGYCSVTFAEKPSREILNSLRAAGFHWGGGSWSGYLEKLPAEVSALVGGAA